MKRNHRKERSKGASAGPANPPRRGLRIPWPVAAALVALLLAQGGLLTVVYVGSRLGRTPGKPAAADGAAPNRYGPVLSRPGPWGRLETLRITIEPPEDFITQYLRQGPTQWFFRDFTVQQLHALFEEAQLPVEWRSLLLATAVQDAPDLIVTPPRNVLLGMSPQTRARIYLELSKNPRNRRQSDPFRFRAESVDDWFEGSGLADSTIALIRSLFYQRGRTVVFSDLGVVMDAVQAPDARMRVLKTLARQSTVLVKLRVDHGADIEAMLDYWGRCGRTRDIKPLLESLAKIPGGGTLDVVHLLPPFARKRLYSYPNPASDTIAPAYDCHWTSMNFWNDPPDDRFANDAAVPEALRTEYDRVRPPYVFGDVVLFFYTGDEAIHSAVYIADDIVFTKNGASPTSPWILMTLPNLMAYYEACADVNLRAYRRKDLSLGDN